MTEVVVLDHTAARGGAELALVRLLNAMPPEWAVRVILFSEGPLKDDLRAAGHTVEVLPMAGDLAATGRHEAGRGIGTLSRTFRSIGFALRVARRLRTLRPALVYTTSLKADLVGAVAAPLSRTPLVWHIHDRIASDYLPGIAVRLIRALAKRVPRRVIANSLATAATLPGVDAVVAYPGFGPEQVGPHPENRARPEVPTVGIIGRVSPTKGQLVFVRAAARVREEFPDARFLIVGAAVFGEETYERTVRDEVARLGLVDVVEFTGFVTDPREVLDTLSVCVHTSPTPEPFGQVIVEAMIRGVPVVATRGGGVEEIVAPGEGPALGWLVEPSDVAGLADAIGTALRDPDEAQRRASAAWESATRRFPVTETARVVSEVWRHLVRGR